LHPVACYDQRPIDNWTAAMNRSRKLQEKRGYDKRVKQQSIRAKQ
jgi:hypothetical protein